MAAEAAPRRPERGARLRAAVSTIFWAVVVFSALHAAIRLFRVQGISMLPAYRSGDLLVVLRRPLWSGQPRPGQVVVLHPPIPSRVEFVKRVVATGGEVVAMQQGRVYVNGRPLTPAYCRACGRASFAPYRVPAGSVFVLGDNRPVSEDSRFFGPVPDGAVSGLVIARLPLPQF
ncbi:Signal peptidase I [Candidatus Hydrogenisulfobacillus filiaventi]|uniref:Signal peptidase I n=1 Tax=Candidatus Hydrogenisulfobacillus filiaventi TaxID=2707344 RepID=A0A6F8ZDF0_9FIRM|nr:signal peptidase I [Bacillota bacterium]CAB1127787.1 Signal peptidase I [Candidatus Hydrogenisulfobacillus filiaventi]